MNSTIRVLYAEDNPQDADQTRSRFAEDAPEFEIEIVDTGQGCLARLSEARAEAEFDLLLLDHHLPDMDGLDVLKTLVHAGLKLPVVLVTGVGDEDLVVRALRLGAANYVPKQGNYLETLPDLLRGVLEEHRRRQRQGLPSAASPRRILYVEHEPMDIELTLRHLAEAAPHFVVDVVRTCAEALARLGQPHDYDLVLIDLRMPDQSGLDFVREAKRRRLLLPPFIMISGKGDDAAAIATLKLGAADYIAKREGYLNQLTYTIDQAISHDRLSRLSEQLQAELAERQRADADLMEMQERLQRAISAGQVGLWDWDLRTNKVYYSPEWKRQIGYDDDEISNDFAEWQSRVHPDDLDHILKAVQGYLSGANPTHEVDFRFRHKDGSYRHIMARGAKLPGDDGTPVRMLGSHVDITERTQLQAQLAQAQKMASVGQLAGGIAHDFNNLLTVINGTADLALMKLSEDNPLRTDFQDIRQAGQRAASLTRQLLALSRKQIMKLEILNLGKLVANLQGMLQRLIGENIDIVVVSTEDLGNVRADPGQIEQVVLNLAINARDAMPTGGILTIETHNVELDEAYSQAHAFVEPGLYVMLSVSDTGVGMDEATRMRIFEPFFTTKEAGRGTGLGLAMVYGIVKQSGGSIWVYSEPGRGTTFKIYLPRVEETTQKDRPARTLATVSGTETILVVEDEYALCQLTRNILQSAGYMVLTAGNGGEALRLLERHDGEVHLMLTDVVMPGGSGPELAAQIADVRPEMKVLYMSGYTDDAIVRHGVLDDTINFIGKPYTVEELTRKVREVLASPVERTATGTARSTFYRR